MNTPQECGMTYADADKLRRQVEDMNIHQLSKLWQWIYMEMGRKIDLEYQRTEVTHCCQKCGMPGAVMHYPGGYLCANRCQLPNDGGQR